MRIACILVTVAALAACSGKCVFESNCAQGEVCSSGACVAKNTTSCDGNTVTQTSDVSVDCARFGAICAFNGDIDWCVRPTGDDACKHVYEDCGKRFGTAAGGPVAEQDCNIQIASQFKPCKLGCFATMACDPASFNACFETQETCPQPPPPPPP